MKDQKRWRFATLWVSHSCHREDYNMRCIPMQSARIPFQRKYAAPYLTICAKFISPMKTWSVSQIEEQRLNMRAAYVTSSGHTRRADRGFLIKDLDCSFLFCPHIFAVRLNAVCTQCCYITNNVVAM